MSVPDLPREILDYTIDLLHDEQETLKQCCLVSKSWVPYARKHLFAEVSFYCTEDLEAWKETFPDPVDSPAHHTRSLIVGCPESVTAADAEEGGWIRMFSRVVRLEVQVIPLTTRSSLSSPSTISHRSSNHSKWYTASFHSREFSTLFFPCLSSRIWVYPKPPVTKPIITASTFNPRLCSR